MGALASNVIITLAIFTLILKFALAVKIQEDVEMHEDRYERDIRLSKEAVNVTATDKFISIYVDKTFLDIRLIGHELFTRSAENIIECVQWCLSYSACQSISFFQPNKQCTLHDVNSSSFNANETEVIYGFIFSDITIWNASTSFIQGLVGVCASRPCSVDQRCFPNQQNHECLNIDCGITPVVRYSTQNSSETLYGSVVEYTCKRGYVITGTATVRCMANAQWTSIPECKRGKDYYCGTDVDYTKYDLNQDGYRMEKRTSITFWVKGVQNARILLQYDNNNYAQGAEIVLGGWGNTWSMIRTTVGDYLTAVSNYAGTLYDEKFYRPFWTTWISGCVQVGTGSNVGSNVIMSWCGLTNNITNMRISFGWGVDGYFRID